MVKNPVMFVVEVGAVASTILAVTDSTIFVCWIVGWLWLTVLFANLAEAVAEGRGKARASTLRRAKTDTTARRLSEDRLSEHEVPAAAIVQVGGKGVASDLTGQAYTKPSGQVGAMASR